MEDHPRDDPSPRQADRARDLSGGRLIGAAPTAAALAAAVALSAGLAFGAGGDAGKGEAGTPKLAGCVADGAAGGCAAPGAGTLRGVSSLTLSADGRTLYASSYGSDSVFAFARGSKGRLAQVGCVADAGAGGCTDPALDSLAGAGGMAVSPGGGDVYVAGGLSRSVTRLVRGDDGALSFGSCTADLGRGGCEASGGGSLAGASAVAVGPGGGDVYVTSFDGGAVTHFVRGADGVLRFADCVADAGNFGCAKTKGSALEGAAAIVLDAKGRNAYVASVKSGTLTRLSRERDGSLRYRECWSGRGENGCRKAGADALVGATGLTLGRGGKDVYVAAQVGAVSRFEVRGSGRLRFGSCVARDGEGGCAQPRRDSLRGASGVAVAGGDVYVTAQGGGTLTRLGLDRRKRLRFLSCVAPKRAAKCGGGVPGAALAGAYGALAQGRSLYVTAPATGAVSAFSVPAR